MSQERSRYEKLSCRKKALLGIAAFNYVDTSIGPYGEIAVFIPVVHGRRPLPLLPALMEASYPGFGNLVLHLPVTGLKPRDARLTQIYEGTNQINRLAIVESQVGAEFP